MAKGERGMVSNAGAWGMNVFSSVGIILVNKQVMSVFGFKYATTLTAMHFAVTSLVGLTSQALGYLPNKEVPLWDCFIFSLVANLSVVGMNVSLMINSVGFYQISKLSIIPTMCVFESVLHKKTFSGPVKGAIAVVLLGVGVCTITDTKFSLPGGAAAAVAILTTALQQIFIGSLQKKHNVGSCDLLSKVAPLQAATLIVTGPFIDYFLTGANVMDYTLTSQAVIFIFFSCSLAVFCNLSQFMVIGRFSAVTFQVLGHIKTLAVLLLGWALFDQGMSMKMIVGISVAVVGMVLYSWALESSKKLLPDNDIKSSPVPLKQSYKEENRRLLLAEEGQIESIRR